MGILEKWFGGKDRPAPEPGRRSRLIASYLDCECEFIPAGADPDEVLRRFEIAETFCLSRGMCPVLIATDDDILAESLFDNADIPLPDGDTVPTDDLEAVRRFREELIASYSPDGAEALLRAGEQTAAELCRNEYWRKTLWDSTIIEFDDNNRQIGAFRDLETKKTRELLLARIPVAEPWQIPAWLPMGSWNDCPSPDVMLSVTKRWYDAYGAVICCVTADELEFQVRTPPRDRDKALALAKEHFCFCEDRLTQYGGHYNLATLADGLLRSRCWYFWWD